MRSLQWNGKGKIASNALVMKVLEVQSPPIFRILKKYHPSAHWIAGFSATIGQK